MGLELVKGSGMMAGMLSTLYLYLCIALGGALGSVSRFALGGWVESRAGTALPWGTLAVNVLGSFVIGLVFYLSAPEGRWALSQNMRQLILVGFCGGFTTFSSFSLQTLVHLDQGQWGRALAYVGGSVLLCLLAVWLGYWLALQITEGR